MKPAIFKYVIYVENELQFADSDLSVIARRVLACPDALSGSRRHLHLRLRLAPQRKAQAQVNAGERPLILIS